MAVREVAVCRASLCRLGASLATFAVLILAAGCGPSIKPEPLSQAIGADEVQGHISFLADPSLAGRTPQSFGSAHARRYIESRFEAYGLKPWGTSKTLAQPFTIGTNIVGVLGGSDPALAGKPILVVAHYDHVGYVNGVLRPGATDNASGVAALLEIAEAMSQNRFKPRRPVVFACTDCEEQGLVGAVAFTCRDDFKPENIVAVVNIDMLGRQMFDVLDKSIIVVGTEGRPGLRKLVKCSAVKAGLEPLLITSYLGGPVGDHIVFEPYHLPCVFFSCGYFSDYHGPRDTADRIDAHLLAAQAGVALDTIAALADMDRLEPVSASASDEREELAAVKRIMATVLAKPAKAGLNDAQRRTGQALLAETDQCLAGKKNRSVVVFDIQKWMFLYQLRLREPAANGDGIDASLWLTVRERYAVIGAGRDMLMQALKNPADVFIWGKEVTGKRHDSTDSRVSVREVSSGHVAFNAILVNIDANASLKGSQGKAWFGGRLQPLGITGSRNEIVDYLLLQSGNLHLSDEDLSLCVKPVNGQPGPITRKQLLAGKLAQTGSKDEMQWSKGLVNSSNVMLACCAMQAMSRLDANQQQAAVRTILARKQSPPWALKAAIEAVTKDASPETLLLLVDLLADTRVHNELDNPAAGFLTQDLFPDIEPLPTVILRLIDNKSNTLADLAMERLRNITGRNIAKDQTAWRKWISQEQAKRN